MWVVGRMSGELPSSPLLPRRTLRAPVIQAAVALAACAVAMLLLLTVLVGSPTPGAGRGGQFGEVHPSARAAATPAGFSLVNLTSNNTTVDVSMPFNVSVDVVNQTGVALNASNFTFVWSGLPAYVPGTPGSGCYGTNPDNNSSVLNCTAASSGALHISVTATNYTNSSGPSNSSSSLTITVNPLPALTSFHVSALNSTLGTQIWFNATATGGTAPVTYMYTGLPLGCSGSNSSFSCTPTRAGLYNVTVTAVDAYGYSSATLSAKVTVSTPTTTKSTGIGSTGWAIVIGIVVVGALATMALLLQARREERAGRMGMEQAQEPPTEESGGSPPMGGSPPLGPSS